VASAWAVNARDAENAGFKPKFSNLAAVLVDFCQYRRKCASVVDLDSSSQTAFSSIVEADPQTRKEAHNQDARCLSDQDLQRCEGCYSSGVSKPRSHVRSELQWCEGKSYNEEVLIEGLGDLSSIQISSD
jgi:hypothetical protein